MAGIADVAKQARIHPDFVRAVFKAVGELTRQDSVSIKGFGTFKTVTKAARTARNPQKPDETVLVPAKTVLTFKASKPKK